MKSIFFFFSTIFFFACTGHSPESTSIIQKNISLDSVLTIAAGRCKQSNLELDTIEFCSNYIVSGQSGFSIDGDEAHYKSELIRDVLSDISTNKNTVEYSFIKSPNVPFKAFKEFNEKRSKKYFIRLRPILAGKKYTCIFFDVIPPGSTRTMFGFEMILESNGDIVNCTATETLIIPPEVIEVRDK